MTERRPNPSDPTAERTSEQSTPSASGLTDGRPDREQGRLNDGDELIPREGEDTRVGGDRRNETERDPVMADDDSDLGIEG
jgi:hypothetical protein